MLIIQHPNADYSAPHLMLDPLAERASSDETTNHERQSAWSSSVAWRDIDCETCPRASDTRRR
jgi:hypothetical protein